MDQPFDTSQSGFLVKFGRRVFPLRGLVGLPFLVVSLIYARPQPPLLMLTSVGWCCLVTGLFLRAWGVAGWYPRRSLQQTAGLITDSGPYPYSRNPRYLGNLCMGLGACWLAGLTGCAGPYFWLWLGLHVPIVLAEEALLSRRFGQPYLDYLREVPRFLGRRSCPPSLWQQLQDGNWPAALRAERPTWFAWLLLGCCLQAYQAAYWQQAWLTCWLVSVLLVCLVYTASRRLRN